MSGEVLIVRRALVWGALAAGPVAALAFALRGASGAGSAVLALAIVLANAGLAAWIQSFAGRWGASAAVFAGLPSYGLRMVGILTALLWLEGRSFVDRPTFVLTFAATLVAVIALEVATWKRTPWIALTLKERS